MSNKCDTCEKKYNFFRTNKFKCWAKGCNKSICEDCIGKEDNKYLMVCKDCKTIYCEEHYYNHGCNNKKPDAPGGEELMYFSPQKRFVVVDVNRAAPSSMVALIEELDNNNYTFIASDLNLFFFKILPRGEQNGNTD
jgi:hypothetical protein